MRDSRGAAGLLQVAEGSLACLDGLTAELVTTVAGFDTAYKRCHVEDLHSALIDTLSQCIHDVSSVHAAAAEARRALACDSALRVHLTHLEQVQHEQRDEVQRLEGRLTDGRVKGAKLAAVRSCSVICGSPTNGFVCWVPRSKSRPEK